LVLDQHYVIQDANRAAIAFFGRALDALRGTPALEVDVLARMLTAGSILQRLKTDAPPVADEVSVTDSEGQPLQARIEAIPYDNGERTLLHFQNTTAVLRTRSALRSAEQLHHAMFEALPAVAWTMALPEERLIEVSPAVERMFGYQPAAFRSDPELWTELVHPADRERVRAEFRRGVASGRPFEIEFTGMHHNHTDLPHLVNRVIPVADERGWVDRCEGFIEDRSAERMLQATLSTTEGHLRHTLESVSSGVLVLRPGDDGVRVELCNRRLALLLRLDEPLRSGTLLAEAPEEVRRLVSDDDRPASFERGVMLEDTTDEIVELADPHRVLRRYSAPVHDTLGSVSGRIITIEDVTSSWLMRRRLTHAQKMESMSRLAGGVAHDFNNLLGAVSGFANMAMEQTSKDDPRNEALTQIVQHTHRATRLTQALLSFSRSARFERMPVALNKVIDESYQLVRSALDPAIPIQYELDHGLPPVMGDALLLQQLIVNLVQEAGADLGAGQVLRVTTRTETGAAVVAPHVDAGDVTPLPDESWAGTGARRVVLEIASSGTRSRDEHPQNGPAYGSAVEPQESEGEIGLAMTIAEDIARVHGGYLLSGAAASPAIYRVGIPVSVSEETPLLPPDESMARGHETVLVVDDEPALLTVAKAGLQQRGFTVVTAENGEQALEILRGGKTTVDLMVLDLSMPGISGDRVLRTLRGFAPDLPVVIASGYATVESQKAWTAAGAQGFVAKPYRIRDLASKLREVLDRMHGRVP
jgi:PAS domain S-box-containing protein